MLTHISIPSLPFTVVIQMKCTRTYFRSLFAPKETSPQLHVIYWNRYVDQRSHLLLRNTLNLLMQLLEKDKTKRLGATRDVDEIKEHEFFLTINWNDLENKRIPPPFNPSVVSSLTLFTKFHSSNDDSNRKMRWISKTLTLSSHVSLCQPQWPGRTCRTRAPFRLMLSKDFPMPLVSCRIERGTA